MRRISHWSLVFSHWLKAIKQRQKGFTLVELLIYSGLLSILLAVLSTLFGMIVDAKLESDSSSSVQQDGQYIVSKLAKDIRSAQAITTPASIGQTTPSLQLTIGSTAYTYSTDANGNLVVTANSASDVLNSYRTSLSNLQFTRMGGNVGGKNSVTFSFTIKSKTIEKSGQETQTFSSTESTR